MNAKINIIHQHQRDISRLARLALDLEDELDSIEKSEQVEELSPEDVEEAKANLEQVFKVIARLQRQIDCTVIEET